MNCDQELIKVCGEISKNCRLMTEQDAKEFINTVIEKFKPYKTSGHLAIGRDSISLSIDDNEFTYSQYLKDEPVYVFFDQESMDRNKVVVIEDGKKLCFILENSYGMEYFVSNKNKDYLIAVNWYVVEGAGSIVQSFSKLT